MKYLFSAIIFTIILFTFSCASGNVSAHREAYISSQPHGWIKISVADNNVPYLFPSKIIKSIKKTEWKTEPPICQFLVKINNERFLYETIFPFGDDAPYKVDTGFKFIAPVGDFKVQILYRNCDAENEENIQLSFLLTLSVEENKVTPIIFNGESVLVKEIEENSVVTLEDIYQKLEKLSSNNE